MQRVLLSAIFSIKLTKCDLPKLSFLSVNFLLAFLNFLASRSIFRLLVRVVLCTAICVRRLPGSMAYTISTVDRRYPPPHTVVEYIERYGARLDGRQFAAMHYAGTAKEICDVRTRDLCKRLWPHGSSGGGIGGMQGDGFTLSLPGYGKSLYLMFREIEYERRVGHLLAVYGRPSFPSCLLI